MARIMPTLNKTDAVDLSHQFMQRGNIEVALKQGGSHAMDAVSLIQQ